MKTLSHLYFILCALLMSGTAVCQIPGMKKYTQTDGFKATIGYTILQDDRGYLWIGTDNGGLRFDGKQFKQLQPIHNASNAEILLCAPLSDHQVACMPVMGDFHLIDHDTVIPLRKYAAVRDLKTLGPYMVAPDAFANCLWLWDIHHKQNIFRIAHNELTRFEDKASGFSFYCAVKGRVVGVKSPQGTLGWYTVETGKLRDFYHADGTLIDSATEVPVWMINSWGKVLTYEHARRLLHVYDWNGKDSILEAINSFPFRMNAIDMRMRSACNRQGRLYFFHELPDKRLLYCADAAAPDAAANLLVMDIPCMLKNVLVDDHNNIWASSADNALYFISERHIYNARLATRVLLSQGIPRNISGAGRHLCVSYANSNALTFLSASGPKHLRLNKRFDPEPRNMEALNDSTIIIYNLDIALLDTRKNTLRYLKIKDHLAIKDICTYKNGWLAAASNGVYFFEQKKGQIVSREIFGKGRSVAIRVMAQDQILIGTPEGLYRKNGLDGAPVPAGLPRMEKEYVTDIVLADERHALIGTNNGIFLYRLHTDSAAGLSSPLASAHIPRRIRQLYRQDNLTFWASTDEGACVLVFNSKRELQSVKNYTFYDGLPSNNVSSVYTWQDTAYVATADGLGVIPLKDTAIAAMPAPRMYIDVVQAGPHFFSSPERNIRLPDNRNELRIVLSAISYESLGNVQYYYRLTPTQADWINTAEPEVRFTRLPPGTYTFEAFSTNARGTKSKVVRLDIYIQPAFWQTLYFKLFLLLCAMGLLFLITRRVLKRSEKRRYMALQQKKHMAELELEAIKAQINPHFISNCLNSIQLLNYNAEYERAQQYLSSFARLIRMTLYFSRKVFITVDEEVAYLTGYLQMEQLRFKDRLNYTIAQELPDGTILIPAMLLQPYVENALKHGIGDKAAQGNVSIRFCKKGKDIEITIKDNGPGFYGPKSDESLGLQLSATRADTYNELFDMQITVHRYNEQEVNPHETGAVIRITIKSDKRWKDQ